MTIAALTFRLAASTIVLSGGTATAHLGPVHSNDPNNPNNSFSKSSPEAFFKFTVTNPDAIDFLVPDAVYDLVMVPRDAGYVISVNAVPADLTPPLSDVAPSAPAADPATPPVDPVSVAAAAPAPESTAPTADLAPNSDAAATPTEPAATDPAAAPTAPDAQA